VAVFPHSRIGDVGGNVFLMNTMRAWWTAKTLKKCPAKGGANAFFVQAKLRNPGALSIAPTL